MKPLLLALLAAIVLTQNSPDEYAIDLDLAPEYRYTMLAQDKKVYITSFLDMLRNNDLYASAFAFSNYLRNNLTTMMSEQFYRECKGIASVIGRPTSQIVVFSHMYELGAFRDFCTSVILINNDGEAVLGRNLDYGFQQYLANSSVVLVYYKNKQEIFRAAGHAGMVGAHTVMRRGSYALSLNQRVEGGLRQTLSQMLTGCLVVPWLMRKTVEECQSVECAVDKLTRGTICAPVYFIVASQTENIVIERSRTSVARSYSIANRVNSFIVQTNTDRSLPDPDGRRVTAEARLSGYSSLSENVLMEVLVQPPNFNNLTLMTVMMNPSRGIFNTTVWQEACMIKSI